MKTVQEYFLMSIMIPVFFLKTYFLWGGVFAFLCIYVCIYAYVYIYIRMLNIYVCIYLCVYIYLCSIY